MTETLIAAEIHITPDGPTLELPADVDRSDAALAIVAFDSFVTGLTPADVPLRASDAETAECRRFRFLVESDGTALVGGRIA